MKSLFKIEKIVKNILTEYETARDNDYILLFMFLKETNPTLLSQPLGQVLMLNKHLGLASIESITRARRKIQENNIELASSKRIKQLKKKQEEYYKFYSREGGANEWKT